MLKSLRQGLDRWRSRNDPLLEVCETGFSLTQGNRAQQTIWTEIRAIFAYKIDLITIDQICLNFETRSGEIVVHEGMQGYEELLAGLERHLGLTPEWSLDVMFPAFEENLTQIYPIAQASAD